MRILVTGAGGQVGLDLISYLRDQGHEVHGSDVAPRPGEQRLAADVPWHALDVTHGEAIEALLREHNIEQVFHLAAILSATGEANPGLTYAVNQGGTHNLLEACRSAEVRRVVFTSTIAVYGPGLDEPVGDDVSLKPQTMYGVTKVAGELLGDYYSRRYDLDFRAVRFPGLISASLPGGGTSDYALFMYVNGIRHGLYESFCRPDTRIPLMYMPDGVRALAELGAADRASLTRTVYNIAAFSPTAQEIADSVASHIEGVELTFAPDPMRQAILDSWPNALDDTLARRDWGWQPSFDLAAMTADLVPKVRALVASNPDRFAANH